MSSFKLFDFLGHLQSRGAFSYVGELQTLIKTSIVRSIILTILVLKS
ncbi:hypothetical protein EDF66_1112 [Sphingobacterium sp. JUb20]|nr:hypothetical protein [Sphingobacterium sp. JUb21]TCR00693.1 hypothetical protein EDF66_1112 [Sphingobacterium sp. JUb20]